MTPNFVVFGNPIQQSKSPLIHRLFAEQYNIELSYDKRAPDVDGFQHAAEQFFKSGGLGANVTMPFKDDAFQFADELTSRATTAQAVNCLIKTGNKIVGDNTDGIGWVNDMIINLQRQLKAKRVLIWGAGGATRGLLQPLIEQQPQLISIYNRTAEKADDLVELCHQIKNGTNIKSDTNIKSETRIESISLKALANESFDIIVNTTAISMSASTIGDIILPDTMLTSSTFCYDLSYAGSEAEPTIFVQWATQRGLAASDGLGMLVEQAAESFRLWHGVQPKTLPVIEFLRTMAIHK